MVVFLQVMLVLAGAIAIAVLLVRFMEASWQKAFKQVAATTGLTYEERVEERRGRVIEVTGVLDGFPVIIDRFSLGQFQYTCIRVETGLPHELLLEREGFWSKGREARLGPDLKTGDREFDAAVVVRGPAEDILARLDADARASALVAVARHKARLERGLLQYQRPNLRNARRIERVLRDMVGLASALSKRSGAERAEAATLQGAG